VVYYIEAYKSPSSSVTPKMSSIHDDGGGDPARLLLHKHDGSTKNVTHSEKNAWVSIDLGEALMVNYYCLCHGGGDGYCLQSRDFEGSNDGSEWTVLRAHKDDNSTTHCPRKPSAWQPGRSRGSTKPTATSASG
jgi:hypothetical protein